MLPERSEFGALRPLDHALRCRAAGEAAVLLNDSVRDLLIPQHINATALKYHDQGLATDSYASAWRRIALVGAVMGLYRLREARRGLLAEWLFTDAELRRLGLPPLEEYVGDWGAFMTVRGQVAGHAFRQRPQQAPGEIVDAEDLGRAVAKAGLSDQDAFLLRVREVLVPAVEAVREQLFIRYPDAKVFATEMYPAAFVRGMEHERGPGDAGS